MVNAASTAKYRPWVEAINQDQLGAFVRHLAGGSGGRAQASTGGAAQGPTIHQTFQTQDLNVPQLAMESARHAAWALS
jgi:hypothetical protein